MSYTVEQLDSSQADQWNNFVSQHPQGTFLQTTYWADLKSHFGWISTFFIIKSQQNIVGGTIVLSRQAPLGQHFDYIPYGPLIDPQHTAALSQLLDQLKQHSTTAIALKIDAAWSTQSPDLDAMTAVFKQHGFTASASMQQPEHTLILDLLLAPDQLMANMRQTTRRYIRQAQKAGLTVDHASGDTFIDHFYNIMTEVGHRKKFGVHTKDYYQCICQAFANSDLGSTHIFLVKQENNILGAYFLLQYGQKAWELYGGLTDQGQQLKAGYLLKWQAIQTMQQLGVTHYDQWGIAPPDQPNHPLTGVTYFKQGFGGTEHLYQGSWTHSAKPFLYSLAKLTSKV